MNYDEAIAISEEYLGPSSSHSLSMLDVLKVHIYVHRSYL